MKIISVKNLLDIHFILKLQNHEQKKFLRILKCDLTKKEIELRVLWYIN